MYIKKDEYIIYISLSLSLSVCLSVCLSLSLSLSASTLNRYLQQLAPMKSTSGKLGVAGISSIFDFVYEACFNMRGMGKQELLSFFKPKQEVAKSK